MNKKDTIKMQLNCPLPEFDFDTITIGHGAGGLLTHELLNEGVFKLLSNPYLDPQHDGATLDLKGPTAFSTDSYVVSPIFFPGGNIGELAVNGTINDLAMCGAMPQYLSLSFIIEEGLKTTRFLEILQSIKKVVDASGVQIVTGDTKVVERGKGDQIFINTSGIGPIHPSADIGIQKIRKGDVVIVSGNIASHGMAVMSSRKGLQFESSIESDTTFLHFIVQKLLDQFGKDIHFLRDPTRGGVASVLNEIVQHREFGIEISNDQLPVLKQVRGACEIFGLDPLYVANEGIFICIADEKVADEVLSVLRKDENGKDACKIGIVCDTHQGKVVSVSGLGGKRVVGMLAGEQLPRIC